MLVLLGSALDAGRVAWRGVESRVGFTERPCFLHQGDGEPMEQVTDEQEQFQLRQWLSYTPTFTCRRGKLFYFTDIKPSFICFSLLEVTAFPLPAYKRLPENEPSTFLSTKQRESCSP